MALWSDIHSNSNASVFLNLSASAARIDAAHVRVDYWGDIWASVGRPSSGDDISPERYIYCWTNTNGWTDGNHIGNAHNWDTIPKNFSGSFTVNADLSVSNLQVLFKINNPGPRFNPSPYTWDVNQGHLNSSDASLRELNSTREISIAGGSATITTYHYCINIPYTQWVSYSSNSYVQTLGTVFKPADHPIGITGFHHNATITNNNYPAFTVMGNTGVNLYYERNAVSIGINANGGSGGTMNWNAGGAVYQNGGTLSPSIRTGYTFAGWTKAGGTFGLSGNSVSDVTVSGSVRANWSPNVYTLTYNAMGGRISPASKSIVCDSVYGTLATPTRAGYTFKGWFSAANGGTRVTENTVCKGNVTIYAQWTANTYTLIYDATGGKISVQSKSVVYDMAIGTLPRPTKKGYRPLGWFTAVTGGTQIKQTAIYQTAGNLTIYAHWEESPTRYDLIPIRTKSGIVKLAKPYISDGKGWQGAAPRISNGTEFIQTEVNPADFE